MELSWSSFILEMINFLVLVWILKRLFYVPIQNVIMQRQQAIQAALDKAQNLNHEAKKLEEKYENRLQVWEVEKVEKKKGFQQELDAWKVIELAKFEKILAEEKNKMHSRDKQSIAEIIDKNTKESFRLAGQFAAKLLSAFADVDIEGKILDEVIVKFTSLPNDRIMLLKNNCQGKVEIISAYTLSEKQKKCLTDKIQNIIAQDVVVNFSQDRDLLAGLTIKIGSVLLQANLRDELKFFTEIPHE